MLFPLLIATFPACAADDQKMRNLDIEKLKEIIQVPGSRHTCPHGIGIDAEHLSTYDFARPCWRSDVSYDVHVGAE